MGKEILTRCGYRCDICHAYKDNILKEDKREMLSKGWHKIFGLNLRPDEIYCEGCITSNESDLKIIDDGCKVRPCVINKGYENCSQCDKFACGILEDRIVRYDELIKNTDKKISRSDRKNCIKPYENYERLKAIREKNGPHSRMYNERLKPTTEDMERFIENEHVIKLWNQFHDYIDKSYDFTKIIHYGGKNYGWEIKYKYGTKSIVSIHPERNAFTILFVFGKNEIAKWEEGKQELSEKTNKLIENTKKYHDGKWIWYRVTELDQIDDYIKLLNIKRKLKKQHI
ncbi:DUF3788 family protein [Clostridiaceae bacterium M8S5]|nr:DUF3788 family protein [Clostridiaceae bacterium M8S5]